MRFTIGTRDKLLRATSIPYRQHFEFSDGRPPLKVGRTGSVLDWLRRAFPRAARGRARSHQAWAGETRAAEPVACQVSVRFLKDRVQVQYEVEGLD